MSDELTPIIDLEMRSIELGAIIVGAITDQERYNDAANRLQELAQFIKDAEARFEVEIRPVHEMHKALCAQRSAVVDPVKKVLGNLKSAVIEFDRQEEARRREEQRRVDEERRQIEEAERVRIAESLKSQGVPEDEAIEAATETHVSIPYRAAPTYDKQSAAGIRTTWKVEVFDAFAFIKWVAKDKKRLALVAPVMPALNRMAQANQSLLDVPGVRPVEERGVTVRR